MENPLIESNIWKKIDLLEEACHGLLVGTSSLEVPLEPGRSCKVVEPSEMPSKKGFSYCEGRAHMLHDLASIELQAAELGVRTLIEFPNAEPDFRKRLAEIVLEEVTHLKLCLEGLEQLGYQWGDWPAQIKLWASTSKDDDLLDRIIIVHRYLEGAGLDASTTLMRRLSGVECKHLRKAIHRIAFDEEAHVEFGSIWFKKFCEEQKLDSDHAFKHRFQSLLPRLPKRLEKINHPLRKKVGFTEQELKVLEDTRTNWLNWNQNFSSGPNKRH